jgi:hypothetical protein
MYRTSRSVVTLFALLILLVLPLSAGARGLDTPRPAASAAEGWLGAALDWFQDVLGLHGRQSRHHAAVSPAAFQTKDGTSTSGATGGSCIDPQGKPWCF